jgi:hypothetical protein
VGPFRFGLSPGFLDQISWTLTHAPPRSRGRSRSSGVQLDRQVVAASDTARKASATFALVAALSLAIGAFIASAAAALGGKQRDDDEVVYLSRR